MKNDLMTLIVNAECPVDGFYPGSFGAMRGCVTRGEPTTDDCAKIVTAIVNNIRAQLEWAGVLPEFIHGCIADIVWATRIAPVHIELSA